MCRGLYTYAQGKFFACNISLCIRSDDELAQVGEFLFIVFEQSVCAVGGAVVDNDHFEQWCAVGVAVVLFQHRAEVGAEVGGLVFGADYNTYRPALRHR